MDFLTDKAVMGGVAAVLAIIGFVPYIIKILRGTNKPHMFSWIIWTIATTTVFFAQVLDGAGAGAWSTGAVLIPNLIVTGLAVRQRAVSITRTDVVLFCVAMFAIVLWIVTDDALYSVILLTGITATGFIPTFRKSWHAPHQETAIIYGLGIVRHTLAVAAIGHYSVVTTLYPASLVSLTLVMFSMLMVRRRLLRVG